MCKAVWVWLLAAACFAQAPEFVVIGEKSFTVSSPFVLQLPEPYDIRFWGGSPGVAIERGPNQATITAKDGRHTITCEAHRILWDDKVFKTDFFKITLNVGGGVPPIDPPPGDPPPGGTIDVTELRALSQAAITELGDLKTAALLRQALANMELDPSASLSDLYSKVNGTVSSAFRSTRLSKDWYGVWRVPVNKWVKANVKTSAGYIKAVNALAATLAAAQANFVLSVPKAPIVNQVEMFTRSPCEPCDRWLREIAPIFRDSGFKVKVTQVTDREAVPRFEIRYMGKRYLWRGFLTLQQAHEILKGKVRWIIK
jgi:hypothetical protein